jgi:hypothetical protein
MMKFKVSPRVAVMLAIVYSVIYVVFAVSMLLCSFIFIQAGIAELAAVANAVLIVPSAIFVLIWREINLIRSKKHHVSATAQTDMTIAVPAAFIGTWKLLKNIYRSLRSK